MNFYLMVHQLTLHFQGVLSLKLYNTISYNYNAIHIQIQYVNFNTFTHTYKLKSTEISIRKKFPRKTLNTSFYMFYRWKRVCMKYVYQIRYIIIDGQAENISLWMTTVCSPSTDRQGFGLFFVLFFTCVEFFHFGVFIFFR